LQRPKRPKNWVGISVRTFKGMEERKGIPCYHTPEEPARPSSFARTHSKGLGLRSEISHPNIHGQRYSKLT
jgi:hypothetical protein